MIVFSLTERGRDSDLPVACRAQRLKKAAKAGKQLYAGVAQLAEQLSCKEKVVSSILTVGTTFGGISNWQTAPILANGE